MIALAIWAVDAAARDGIASLIEDAPGVEVVGVVENELALIRLLEAVRVDSWSWWQSQMPHTVWWMRSP